MTVFFDPFREMDRLSRELLGQRAQGGGPRWMPMDLYREGDHFVANIDLPGVDPGSIDIDVEGSTLTIRAQRTFRSGDAEWLSQERPSGTFMRQIGVEPYDLGALASAEVIDPGGPLWGKALSQIEMLEAVGWLSGDG